MHFPLNIYSSLSQAAGSPVATLNTAKEPHTGISKTLVNDGKVEPELVDHFVRSGRPAASLLEDINSAKLKDLLRDFRQFGEKNADSDVNEVVHQHLGERWTGHLTGRNAAGEPSFTLNTLGQEVRLTPSQVKLVTVGRDADNDMWTHVIDAQLSPDGSAVDPSSVKEHAFVEIHD